MSNCIACLDFPDLQYGIHWRFRFPQKQQHPPLQQEQKKISINSATEKELQTLTGIGPSMAQRIIAYRSQQPFQTIEDIMKVKGIKEKLFAKIKEQITL